jgi:hypothetical protein
MERHHTILRQVTAEWDAKARIHREAARYWDVLRLLAKDNCDEQEETRATERYHFEMSQATFAHSKLKQCIELRSAL